MEIARRLRSEGVHAEVIVAVSAERSIETVTAILAILEAGGAFLPIDPEAPGDRVAYMLDDARAALVLGPRARSGAFTGRRFLAIDDPCAPWSSERPGALTDTHDPSSLAYVLYTSGSTGRPKG